jgi:hypothetical protein
MARARRGGGNAPLQTRATPGATPGHRAAARGGRPAAARVLRSGRPLGKGHTTLAALVGARRPSVTTALGQLAGARVVERVPDGWLLHDSVEALAARVDDPALRIAAG